MRNKQFKSLSQKSLSFLSFTMGFACEMFIPYKLIAYGKRQRTKFMNSHKALFTSSNFDAHFLHMPYVSTTTTTNRVPSDQSIIIEIVKHYIMNMHTNNVNKLLIPPLQYLPNGFHLITVLNARAISLGVAFSFFFLQKKDNQFQYAEFILCYSAYRTSV